MTFTHTGSEPSPGEAPERSHEPEDEKSREVRLGLVLYGGVSLAIYMNGISHEFFRAVRGRGVYRLIKALTDSEVVVDVVSGTSAGGINGIFLAFCLCNEGSEFGRSASLWRESGGIRELLRPPGDPAASCSLLNSDGYYEPRLRDALARMYPRSLQAEREEDFPEEPSPVNELDLFVTGTDVDGNITTRFDDAGTSIDIKNYRSVFLLKHRQERKVPFLPEQEDVESSVTVKALAKLACITSCFPAAFTPVRVSTLEDERDGAKEDALLALWGKLAPGSVRCFLDGGVLDNKPFSYTLQTIASRHAVREVDRKLCYLEPVPESYEQIQFSSQPDIFKALVTSLIGIPGYESIEEDLQALSEHNSRVERYNRIAFELREKPGGTPPGEEDARKASPIQQVLYRRSRLIALSERVLRGIFREKGRDVSLPLRDPNLRDRAAALVRHFDQVVGCAKHARKGFEPTRNLDELDVEHLLGSLDVSFRLRRLYHTVYYLHGFIYNQPSSTSLSREQVSRCRKLWRALNRQIELHEIVQAGMRLLIDHSMFDWSRFDASRSPEDARELWCQAQRALERLLDDSAHPRSFLPRAYHRDDSREWLSTSELVDFHSALTSLAWSIAGDVEQSARPTGKSLLRVFEAYERDIFEHFIPESSGSDPVARVRRAYERFETLDTLLFPMDLMGGLREMDLIRAIRISPGDAHQGFSSVPAENKLSGDLAHHFGGFFKRSWRANDILWGRLDGVCQLVEVLLTPERLKRLRADKRMLETVRHRMLKFPKEEGSALRDEYDPARLFPYAGKATHESLSKWIQRVLSMNEDERDDPLSDTTFHDMRKLLIEAAQLEVLDKELPNVLEDASDELADWKGEGLVRGEELRKLELKLASMRSQLEQARARRGHEDVRRPVDTALGRYFRTGYTVGKEALTRDIPFLVLLDVTSRALPVLRSGLMSLTERNMTGFMRGAVRFTLRLLFGLAAGARLFIRLQRHLPVHPRSRPPSLSGHILPATPQEALKAGCAIRSQAGSASGDPRRFPFSLLSRLRRPAMTGAPTG